MATAPHPSPRRLDRRPRSAVGAFVSLLVAASLLAAASAFVLAPIRADGRLSGDRARRLFDLSSTTPANADFARVAASKVLPSVASVVPVGVRNVTSRGTGFVVDVLHEGDDGATVGEAKVVHLLTAAHVASPGSRLSVSFSPELDLPGDLPASLVGRDTAADLALIRVEIPGDDVAMPPSLNFYGSDDATGDEVPPIGTLAFACGHPSGMDGAAFTMGILCGTSRGLEGVAPWMGNSAPRQSSSEDANSNSTGEEEKDDPIMFQNVTFVVTDASMAPGMSGGPLADVHGEVMGMCALVRPDLRALGNYAVSAGTCRRFLDKMRSKIDTRIDGERAGPWDAAIGGFRVVLFNDRMNKKERVAKILRDVAELDDEAAEAVMMAAHTTGRGVIKTFAVRAPDKGFNAREARALADKLCDSMRIEDVLVEVEEIP